MRVDSLSQPLLQFADRPLGSDMNTHAVYHFNCSALARRGIGPISHKTVAAIVLCAAVKRKGSKPPVPPDKRPAARTLHTAVPSCTRAWHARRSVRDTH